MAARRVALVSSSYHPHVGGVEEHVRRVAAELKQRGHDVVVWTVDRGEHLGVQEVDGVEVRYLPTPLPARSAAGLRRMLARGGPAVGAWLRAYRSFRPDVIHVQCFGPNGTYATALARLTGTPLVVSSHGETFADDHAVFDRSALSRRSLRWALGRVCAVTGCSQVVLDDLARFGLRDGVVVPNGVDLAAPDAALDAWNGVDLAAPVPDRAPADPPYVLAYGRVERTKGFDLLLEAFAQADLPAGTRLVVGGDGSALAGLRSRADELGVADRVEFPGRLARSEIDDLLAGASVVVVPSRREAFGIVVLEAWRAGVPVVAPSYGGPATLVTDGVDGLQVDPADTVALGAAISRVLTDPGLAVRLVEGGRRAVQGYGWDRVTSAYEGLRHRG